MHNHKTFISATGEICSGAVFSMYFPVLLKTERVLLTTEPKAAMNLTKRIMLIDDDPDDQLFFRDAVHTLRPDLQCELASSCMEALKQMEESHPDLIFMDLNMPVMNGFDCLAYLKNKSELRDIPVIIFTTSTTLSDINRTRQLGASWFMTKPNDFNVLCKKLNKIIHKDSLEGQFMI
jgi:CheY-like chemotaxis protein